MEADQLDAMAIQPYLLSAHELMTPHMFERITQESQLNCAAIMAVNGPGQLRIPRTDAINLYMAINRVAGESVVRLLSHNMGLKMVEFAKISLTGFFGLENTHTDKPAVDRAYLILVGFIDKLHTLGIPLVLTTIEPKHWRVTHESCLVCAGAHTSKPVCAVWSVFLLKMMQHFCKMSFSNEEIMCKGAGQNACVYDLKLLSAD